MARPNRLQPPRLDLFRLASRKPPRTLPARLASTPQATTTSLHLIGRCTKFRRTAAPAMMIRYLGPCLHGPVSIAADCSRRIITADSERDAAEVEQSIVGAVRDASEAQAVAYCTVPQSSMARVIGRGGSGLATLRGSGAHVETLGGRRGSDTLSVVGTRDQLAAVRDGIEKLLSR